MNMIWKRMRWDKWDEKEWKEDGKVWCPSSCTEDGESTFTKITEPPPSKCPFIFEHTTDYKRGIFDSLRRYFFLMNK